MSAYKGTSKKSKVVAIDDVQDIEEQTVSIQEMELYPLLDKEIFQPDKVKLLDLDKKGPVALNKQKEKNLVSTVNLVHSIELLAPGIVSAMSFGGTTEQQVERFIDWSSSIKEKAVLWANALPVESEKISWVVASLERVLAQNPFLNKLSSIDFLIPIAIEHELPPEHNWIPDEIASPLVLLEALGSVAQAQATYSLYRNSMERDMVVIAEVLVKTAQEAVVELVDPTFSSDSRQVVFTTVLKQFGNILKSLWLIYAKDVEQKIGRSGGDLERWKASHPEGASLEPLLDNFYDLSTKLIRLSRMAKYK